jgi:hypothetical protein
VARKNIAHLQRFYLKYDWVNHAFSGSPREGIRQTFSILFSEVPNQITVNIWIPVPEIQAIQWNGNFLVPVFIWFIFQMVGFKGSKPDKMVRFLNGHSMTQLFYSDFKWLKQLGSQNSLVLVWSVSAEINHLKTRLVRFSDVYSMNDKKIFFGKCLSYICCSFWGVHDSL